MIAARAAGEIFDRAKSYDLLCVAFFLCMILGAGVLFATRFTPLPPERAPVAT